MKKADIFVVISYKFCVFSCLIWASHPLIFETSITPLLRMVFLIWGVSINFWLWSINWKISQISSDGSVIFSLDRGWVLIWNLSSDCVVGITALSPSRLLVTKMVGVLTVTDAADTSTVLVVLLSKTLEVEEAEEEFFNKWKRWRHYLFKIKFHTKLGCCTCKEKFYYRKLRSSPFIRRGLETNGK